MNLAPAFPAANRPDVAEGWFGDTPTFVADALAAIARERHLADGDLLHAKGDAADGYYGVRTGHVRISTVGINGRPFTLAFLGAGAWFGEISLFDQLPRTHDAHAQGETNLWVVSASRFRELLAQQSSIAAHFNRQLALRVRYALSMFEEQALTPVVARLARRLLDFAPAGASDGHPCDPFRLSQHEYAAMLGTSRQCVNRALQDLTGRGLIRVHYEHVVVLDRAGLGTVARSA